MIEVQIHKKKNLEMKMSPRVRKNTMKEFYKLKRQGVFRNQRNTLRKKIAEIQLLVESCSNTGAIESVCTHFNSAICVVKAVQKTHHDVEPTVDAFVSRKRPAPNSNSEVQLRFHSTKQKKPTKRTRLAKPTIDDEERVKQNLDNIAIQVCGVCLREDNAGEDNAVDWIECVQCHLWVHTACASLSADTLDFLCVNCTRGGRCIEFNDIILISVYGIDLKLISFKKRSLNNMITPPII